MSSTPRSPARARATAMRPYSCLCWRARRRACSSRGGHRTFPPTPGRSRFPAARSTTPTPSPVAAALREAHEEIGLDASVVSIVGELEPYLTGTGYRVVPVLARVEPMVALHINQSEVEEVFEVPLSFLMTPAKIIAA